MTNGHYWFRGTAAIVAGATAVIAAEALRARRRNPLRLALIVMGLATCVGGVEGYWADHRMLTGAAVFAFGAVVVGGGVTLPRRRHFGGVRTIGLHEIMSKFRQIHDWLDGAR